MRTLRLFHRYFTTFHHIFRRFEHDEDLETLYNSYNDICVNVLNFKARVVGVGACNKEGVSTRWNIAKM